MKLMTLTELAKVSGVSRQAVQKAIKKESLRIVMEGKRPKIDLHDALTIQYLKSTSTQRLEANKAKGIPIAKKTVEYKEPKKNIVIPEDEYSGDIEDEAEEIKNGLTPTPGSKWDFDTQKSKAMATKINLEVAEKMGLLVLRERVDHVFGAIYMVAHNYFLPLGERTAELIAGKCGVTDPERIKEIQIIIDSEITRGLDELKRSVERKI